MDIVYKQSRTTIIPCNLLFILSIVVILYNTFYYHSNQSAKLSNNFYDVDQIEPKLNDIYHNLKQIKNEIVSIKSTLWTEWPEYELYNKTLNPDITTWQSYNFEIKKNDYGLQ